MSTFTTAIVRPPAANFGLGLTISRTAPPDHLAALEQHARYCDALAACGLAVRTLPPDAHHPDAAFVEDTAIVTPRGALLTRPGAASRQGETAAIAAELQSVFGDAPRIEPPGTLDGGDVCLADDFCLVGLSGRTNFEGARQLGAWLAMMGRESTMIDVRGVAGLLHLKSGLSHLGGRRLLVAEALAAAPELVGFDLVVAPDAERYAANCLYLNGQVLAPAGHARVAAALRGWGLPVVSIEMSEFRKMDGGLTCLSLRF